MNILIVDDEKLARDRLVRLIEKSEQHTVVGEANNGHAAIEKIEKLQPDIVLLDIRMPGMDGLEVARHLTKLENPPAIIFCTAYGEYALEAFQTPETLRRSQLQAISRLPPCKPRWHDRARLER